jgi:hypothetical protein
MWAEIHECINTNNLEQLMTLLSNHAINLNSLNLYTDGDTILHSAAKSNSMEMIQFVHLHSITTWTRSMHFLFPLKFRQAVKAVLMLGAKRQDGTPYHPQTYFYKIPKDVLFIILEYVALPDQPEVCEDPMKFTLISENKTPQVPPVWVPDDMSPACLECGIKFSLTIRKVSKFCNSDE